MTQIGTNKTNIISVSFNNFDIKRKLFISFSIAWTILTLSPQFTNGFVVVQSPISALGLYDEPLRQQGHYSVPVNPITLPNALNLHRSALNQQRE